MGYYVLSGKETNRKYVVNMNVIPITIYLYYYYTQIARPGATLCGSGCE